MPFQTSIQTFAGTNTPQSAISMMALPNWGSGEVWIINTVKFSKSSVVGGTELSHAPLSDYQGLPNHVGVSSETFGLAPNGQLHVTSGTGFSIIDKTTLVMSDTWGAYGGFFPPGLPSSTALNALAGSIMVITTPAGKILTFGVGVGGIFGAFNEGYLAELPSFAGLYANWATPSRGAYTCRGAAGSGFGYFVEAPSVSATQTTIHKLTCSDGGSWVPGDWPTPNPKMVQATLATLVPTDLDAGWTEISPGGLCLDKSDNNLLVFFTGQGGATNPNYLAKVNATSGAIIWQTVVPGSTIPGGVMAQGNANGSIALYVHSPAQVMTFDTSDGSVSTYSSGLAGITAYGPQCFDTSTGIIIILCSWNVTAGGPTPLGGSTGPFTGFAALYVAPSVVPRGRRFEALLGPAASPTIVNYRVTQASDTRVTMSGDTRTLLP